jgi:two-component system, chemotaxis family, sensor kinase CheA
VSGAGSEDGIDLDQLRQMFLAEAREMTAALEVGALALEQRPDDPELINDVFRSAHTLKGAAGTCGMLDVAELTHDLETMLDLWRNKELQPGAEHFSVLLRTSDMLAQMIELDPEQPSLATAELRAELARLAGHASASVATASAARAPAPAAIGGECMRIHFRPQPEAFQCGGDPGLVFRELRTLSSALEVTWHDAALPGLDQLVADNAYAAWDVRLVPLPGVDANRVREAFAFFDGVAQLEVELDSALSTPPSAAASSAEAAEPERARGADKDASTLRVATDKIDKVIDLVGELVIAHSAVRELVRMLGPAKAVALQEAVLLEERHLRELQERVMAVRMVPVGSVFARLPRLVRDLSQKLGKNVRLELKGGDTELDKTLIEKLGDPLLHLVRNSLDHGIETPAERQAAGKPETALLRASAFARGGNVFIEVSDDGRGLDRERIRARAVQRGLISETDELSEDQVFKLICSPGFSTKEDVSDVSGRGVGLDVVQRNIQELGGGLQIESEFGHGACFSMRLPLTLTIVDGLLLSSGAETCVMPLLDVAFSLRIAPGQARPLAGVGEILDLPGEALPLLDLSTVLGRRTDCAEPGPLAVVVHSGNYRYALRVDALLGQTQAVVKSIETHYRRVPGIMGATILGNGKVALILDGPGVASAAGLRRGRGDEAHAAHAAYQGKPREGVAWRQTN